MVVEKERKELSILSRIFKEGNDCEILKSERPDFIVTYPRHFVGGISVGIEVTELYYNDSSARLKNKEGYIKNVIDGSYIHKDDKGEFNVQEVTYLPQGVMSKAFKTKILIEKKYTIDDYRRAFLHTLRKKNKKRTKYQVGLAQTCLVIYDREKYFSKISKQDFVSAFFNSYIMDEIKESPFEEIYLITSFNGGPEEFYVQLKYCLLQNEQARLLDYLASNSLFSKLVDLRISVDDVFAEVLTKKGYLGVRKHRCNDVEAVGCVRYSFNFNESSGRISVFDGFPVLQSGTENFIVAKNFFSDKSFSRFLKDTSARFASFDVGFETFETCNS